MKKKILTIAAMKTKTLLTMLCAIFLSCTKAVAQDYLPVKNLELEVKVGTTYPTDHLVGSKRLGVQFGVEGRRNFNDSPFDLGAELYMGAAFRHYEGEGMSHRCFSFSAFGDYNFSRGANVSPFVGIGIGLADCNNIKGSYGTEGKSVLFTPRVGVEFSRHLRLTFDARIARNGYNTIGLSVGYVFGGGLK